MNCIGDARDAEGVVAANPHIDHVLGREVHVDEAMPGEDAGDEDGEIAKQLGPRLKIRFTDRTALKGLIGKHTNVRAFDRTITVKPDVDAHQEFARLIQGRSIKPVGAK
nr:hypothetical protein [Mesorhizobium sp.]